MLLGVEALLIPLQAKVSRLVAHVRMVTLLGWNEFVALAAMSGHRVASSGRLARVREAAVHALQLFAFLHPHHCLLVLRSKLIDGVAVSLHGLANAAFVPCQFLLGCRGADVHIAGRRLRLRRILLAALALCGQAHIVLVRVL